MIITPQELQQWMDNGKSFTVVDMRPEEHRNEFLLTGLNPVIADANSILETGDDTVLVCQFGIVTEGIIVDTDGPLTGTVLDGAEGDVDWANVDSVLTFTWYNFSDTLSGLSYYEYAVGTTSGGTETISWTSASRLDSTITLSALSLTNTATYYPSVRAVDSVGNVSSTVTSDGFTPVSYTHLTLPTILLV